MILYGTMLACGVMAGIVAFIISLLSCCYPLLPPDTIHVMRKQKAAQNNPELVSNAIRSMGTKSAGQKLKPKLKIKTEDNEKEKTSASTI